MRRAGACGRWAGETFEGALKAALGIEAGRQLREGADEWQVNVARKRAEERVDALGWRSPGGASGPSAGG